MRIDLHCHTRYSRDSLTSFDALLRWMDRRGLDMVAITDHNTLAGALDFHSHAPDRFLVGEEIKTIDGEVIGLFLQEEVPGGLPLEETISLVRAQGGIVGASHPCDRWRDEGMGGETLEAVHEQLDFIEVLNARMIYNGDNLLAQGMAERWGLPGSAGSDAHAPFEVGRAYVEMSAFEGRDDFLECLGRGEVHGRVSSPMVHFVSTYAKWRERLGAR
jgi:predicted metal-dependent phosphoesterase TrpH